MMQTIMVFVIVLAAIMMTGGSLGKKVTDGARDFNIPMPGAYCPGDVGVVDYKMFLHNLQLAAAVAWNGQRACWLKQELVDPDYPGLKISYSDIYKNITHARNTFAESEKDDCLVGYFTDTSPGGISELDMVFWWDDKADCKDGLFSGTRSWVEKKTGASQDTLYFYKRIDYCIGETYEDWYTQLGNSNIDKFSRSKGRLNDANICKDETDSGGDDYTLPWIRDYKGTTDNTVKSDIISDIRDCIYFSELYFAGGWSNEKDNSEDYVVCDYTYIIKPEQNYTLNGFLRLYNSGTTPNPHLSGYKEDDSIFDHDWSECDILNDAGEIDFNEFNSVTWNRDSKNFACIYYIKDRLIKTETDISNPSNLAENKFVKDNTYKITAFYYFEADNGLGIGRNDLIWVIDTQ